MQSHPTRTNFDAVQIHETSLKMQKRSPLLLKLLPLLVLLFVGWQSAFGQVYPGDANNDGTVNNIDILYIGYAYNTYGPTRADGTVDYQEVAVPLLWSNLFPDSTNFAFADADGNGLIDISDFLTVYRNYGNKRVNPQPTTFLEGMADFDPRLRIEPPSESQRLHEGDTVELPIFLEGANGDTIQNVNGIAFSLEFDPSVFKSVSLNFDNSWLSAGSDPFYFQIVPGNRLAAAITRFGRNPVRGTGKIATLRAVIEDDLIALLTRDSLHTSIRANYIKLIDSDFRDIATAGSEIVLTIFDSAMAVPVKEVPLEQLIQFFPNPTSDVLQINASVAINRIEIFNAQGQCLAQRQLQSAYSLGLSLNNQAPGLVFIKIYTEKGNITQKVMIR